MTQEQRQQLIALCNWKIDNIPLQLEELIQAFNKNKSLFDPDHITLEEREKLRSSFVSDFPVDLDMKLDDYVEGKPYGYQQHHTEECWNISKHYLLVLAYYPSVG